MIFSTQVTNKMKKANKKVDYLEEEQKKLYFKNPKTNNEVDLFSDYRLTPELTELTPTEVLQIQIFGFVLDDTTELTNFSEQVVNYYRYHEDLID
jgi:hypothetical protein